MGHNYREGGIMKNLYKSKQMAHLYDQLSTLKELVCRPLQLSKNLNVCFLARQ